MPKIVVKRKAEVYKEFPIRPFQSRITVGSEGDNDLIIADKKVSMHHLVIEKEGTAYYVRDNKSAFGTFVNGNRISDRTPIVSGDEIAVGEHTLIFENVLFEKSMLESEPEESTGSEDDQEITDDASSLASALETKLTSESNGNGGLTETAQTKTETTGSTEAVSAKVSTEQLTPHYLLAIHGPYLGKRYRLNFGITRIGRDQTFNDIVIRETTKGEVDTSISRRHATIVLDSGKYYIMDKRSKTRTRVNQKQLSEEDVVQLFPDDEIEIVSDRKSTIFRFEPESIMDFSYPKRAGTWWDRNAPWLVRAASGVCSLLLLILMVNFWSQARLINQQPNPFQVRESQWVFEQGFQPFTIQPNEAVANMLTLAPTAADLTGDGVPDVAYIDPAGHLNVIDGKTRKNAWGKSFDQQIQPSLGIVLADLNKNQLADILFPANNSILYAIDGKTGTEIWSSPLFGERFSGNPAVADINGDGLLDIFLCCQSGQIHIGKGQYGGPDWSSFQAESELRCTPSAGDVDNDGVAEVVIGTENGKILIYDGARENFSQVFSVNEELQKAKGSFYEDHQIRQRVAIGQLNDDNYADLVILTEQQQLLVLDGKEMKRLWFDEIESGLKDAAALLPPVLGDVNGDGRLEVVLATADGKIIVYEGTGKGSSQRKIIWAYVPESVEEFIASPILVDLNKDRKLDVVIAGSYDGLYLFNGPNGKLLNTTTPVNSTDDLIIGTPVVADFKHDKSLDILLRRNNDNFFLATTNSKIKPGSILWGQINFNAQQDGCNALRLASAAPRFMAATFFFLAMLVLIGYNIYQPIKRRKLFASAT
ncbi:MAG: FHA domain-containing protein [candidate division KSB1 bacterium]|nr:FHA domain-containing protein [candidate division KSB1 bacterium]MDZ7341267.1 FHA domain-containing protein [candidate division KSB1 bacterium]